MLQSMTGYGKSTFEKETCKIAVEIKTLNGKQLDLYIKLPNNYKEKESILRNEISKNIERGKIDVTISVEITNNESNYKINTEVLKSYYNQLKSIDFLPTSEMQNNWLEILLKLPESIKSDNNHADELVWEYIFNTFMQALKSVSQFREQEGIALMESLKINIHKIESAIPKIENFEPLRIDAMKKKLSALISQNIPDSQTDKNRLEQEIIYYIEKFDINEEKVRLKNHCKYFITTMENECSVGKKLGFIAQEIGREINTIGSKANDFEIQKIVVEMKDELEKAKEQLMNVL
jgi:uncharacterized protein (TIGR00255 family)